jgi:hypothetical protein
MVEVHGNDGRVIPFKPRHYDTPEQQAARLLQEHNRLREWGEDWLAIRLPWLRLATAVAQKDDEALEVAIRKLAFCEGQDGSLAVVFRRWREAKQELDTMRQAVDIALTRSLDILERIADNLGDLPPRSA